MLCRFLRSVNRLVYCRSFICRCVVCFSGIRNRLETRRFFEGDEQFATRLSEVGASFGKCGHGQLYPTWRLVNLSYTAVDRLSAAVICCPGSVLVSAMRRFEEDAEFATRVSIVRQIEKKKIAPSAEFCWVFFLVFFGRGSHLQDKL